MFFSTIATGKVLVQVTLIKRSGSLENKKTLWGWRCGSMVKSTCCFSKGPKFQLLTEKNEIKEDMTAPKV